MADHDWEDLGPVLPLAGPARGRMWTCRTCGSRIRSNQEPRPDAGTPFVLSLTPQGWKPGPVRSDCHEMIVREVMAS